jgi:hypothetical protein
VLRVECCLKCPAFAASRLTNTVYCAITGEIMRNPSSIPASCPLPKENLTALDAALTGGEHD